MSWPVVLLAACYACAACAEVLQQDWEADSEECLGGKHVLLLQHSLAWAPEAPRVPTQFPAAPLTSTPSAWLEVVASVQALRGSLTLSLLPSGAMAAASLLGLGALRCYCGWCSMEEVARAQLMVQNFFSLLLFTSVVLDSNDLCATLGQSQAASGRMVGTYNVGDIVGTLVAWLVVRAWPEHWRVATHSTLAVSLGLMVPCALLYCHVAKKASAISEGLEPQELRHGPAVLRPGLARLLTASRFLGGLGFGCWQQFGLSSLIHITGLREREEVVSWWTLSTMVALGAGPLLAAAMHALDFSRSGPGFIHAGYLQLIAVAVCFLGLAGLPSLAEATDAEEPGEQDRVPSRVVVSTSLLLSTLRGFGVAALEVGLALAWEESYGWNRRLTGLVTGAVFLSCIPMKALQARWARSLSVVAWVRVLTGAAMLGALLLFTFLRPMIGAPRLVLGGLLLFPCLYLSDALNLGLMYQHVLPEGSAFDANHAAMATSILQNLGRYLGSWTGRLLLERLGEDAFAAAQLLTSAAFLLGFELLLVPSIAPGLLPRDQPPEARKDGK